MSEILRVEWTIVPQKPPQPLLHCNRCNGTKSFRTSDKIRVNANGKRVDAWLIYKCTWCDSTWNRPVLERRHVRSIDPLLLMALRANDPKLARRMAFDAEDLRRRAGRLEEFNDVVVLKEVLSESIAPTRLLEVLCVVPHPITLAWTGFLQQSCTCRGAASEPGNERGAGCLPVRIARPAQVGA